MVAQYANNYEDTTNFSDTTIRLALTDGAELTYTVPGNAENRYQALFGFSSNATIYVGYNSTAAIPADNTLVSTGRVEVNPQKRFVNGGDVLSFVTSDATAGVGVSLRALP
jgi:hypothetical protein